MVPILFAQVENLSSQDGWQKLGEKIAVYIPNVIAAIVILIAGWLVALLAAALLRGAMRKTGLNRRLGQWFAAEPGQMIPEVERPIAKGVFCLIMLFVLVAFFETRQFCLFFGEFDFTEHPWTVRRIHDVTELDDWDL